MRPDGDVRPGDNVRVVVGFALSVRLDVPEETGPAEIVPPEMELLDKTELRVSTF